MHGSNLITPQAQLLAQVVEQIVVPTHPEAGLNSNSNSSSSLFWFSGSSGFSFERHPKQTCILCTDAQRRIITNSHFCILIKPSQRSERWINLNKNCHIFKGKAASFTVSLFFISRQYAWLWKDCLNLWVAVDMGCICITPLPRAVPIHRCLLMWATKPQKSAASECSTRLTEAQNSLWRQQIKQKQRQQKVFFVFYLNFMA